MISRGAFLLLALPFAASAGEITFVSEGTARTVADPHAVIPARQADPQVFSAMLSENVGLLVEDAEGASIHASNLFKGALVRRFSGHVNTIRPLGAGRLLTLYPEVTLKGDQVDMLWRLLDERGDMIAGGAASVQMSGAEAPDRPFAGFTAEDAERLAFQVAAVLRGSSVIADAETLARLDNIPAPKPAPVVKPETSGAEDLILPPPDALPELQTEPPVPPSPPE